MSRTLGYAVGGLAWSPRWVHRTYQSRFAIESSYRMRNQVKPRIGTRNPVIRYLYGIISFFLRSVWIALLWMHFSAVKRGTEDHRNARVPIRMLQYHNLGNDLLSMGMVNGIPVFDS